MKVLNIHKRFINQPKEKVSKLLETLATKEDKLWPNNTWPAIHFKDGLVINSKGGHGIIRYFIIDYNKHDFIKFQFTGPKGFNGTHEFQINKIDKNETEVIHIIKMETSGKATWSWLIFIRSLHNALIEDAFDKIESQFSSNFKWRRHPIWVKFLRYILKPKKANLKTVNN